MLFNSYIFILAFLPITLIGYYLFNHFKQYKLASVYLIGMSMWFYGYNNIYYLLLLIVSIIVNYFIVFLLFRFKNRRLFHFGLFLFGMLFNLGLLFYYKYYDFFVDNINVLFKTDFILLYLALPLGISFFTFQQLSYVIDCYKGNAIRYNFIEYAAYVSFFPQLIAGPIVLHNELIPQFRDHNKRILNYDNLSKGIYAFGCGLGKKVLLADSFSKIVTAGYADISALNTTSTIIVILCYTFQIYFDFSGYCDMAYGIGYMFNITLPVNFNSPYKADSIADFWRRWHITLSRFFTQYIYIPLGGNRKGLGKTLCNTMIVFFISGLWHGANWTFVIWGVLNGIGICFNRLTKTGWEKVPKMIRIGFTFIFVSLGWGLFRSSSILEFIDLMKVLFSGTFGMISPSLQDAFTSIEEIRVLNRITSVFFHDAATSILLVGFILFSFIIVWWLKNTQEKVLRFTYSTKQLLGTLCIIFWSIISLAQISEFLYFNF